MAGLELYATASRSKRAIITQFGGHFIDYRSEDVVTRVRELSGDGVDLVFDPIGGRNVARSLKTMRAGGRLVVYGFQTGHSRHWRDLPRVVAELLLRTRFDPMKAADSNQGVFAFNVATLKRQRPMWHHEDLTTLFELLIQNKIRPIVADRLPLSRAAEAHQRLEQSAVVGKLVLIPSMTG